MCKMAYENDILTRNDNDELAVRVVSSTEGTNNSSYDDIYTRDTNGKLAVRVVGAGGGDSHNKGYFATPSALETAYPIGEEGDYAIVGSTDTVWIWDGETSAWVDTDTKGEVTSVNGQTGTVVLSAKDVSAIPQYSTMPVASAEHANEIVQYSGVTNANYTNGYFYKEMVETGETATVELTTGSGLTDLAVDVERYKDGYNTQHGENPPESAQIEISYVDAPLFDFIETTLTVSGDIDTFYAKAESTFTETNIASMSLTFTKTADGWDITSGVVRYMAHNDQSISPMSNQDLAEWGLEITAGTPQVGDTILVGMSGYWVDVDNDATSAESYGIMFKGEPEVGDVFTVTYSADTPIGYSWECINVQPEGSTYLTYPAGWVTNSTTKAFCDSIAADTTAVKGKAYLGEVTLNDMPAGIVNAEIVVEIMDGTTAANKVIKLTLSSGSVAPYMWIYTYWNGGSNTSGWQALGGGNGGIDWKTTVDLPANSGLSWSAFPIYTIQGGLPDGEYEFYWQVKVAGSNEIAPLGAVTYNCRFKITDNNGTKYCYGSFAPVIDGDGNWLPSSTYIPEEQGFYNFLYVLSNNDYIMYSPTVPWVTDIVASLPSMAVPECFKISAIKNLGTDTEYIPTGELFSGSYPSFDHEIGTQITSQRFAPAVSVPQYHQNITVNYDDNQQYITIYPHTIANGIGGEVECSELDFSIENDVGKYHAIVENTYGSYVVRVLDASGDFANTQIGWNASTGNTYVYLNTAVGTSGSANVSVGIKGSSNGVQCWVDTPSSFVAAQVLKVGATVTPQNLGVILQHTGATDVNYTNGYFYKATGTAVTTPEDIAISNMSPNDLTLTISNVGGFISAIASSLGWNINYLKQQFANGTSLAGYWDADNDAVTVVNIGFIGDITDSTVLSYVSMSTTGSYSGEVYFYSDAVYTPTHTEIQNGSWDRVDVQPSGAPTTATATLTVNDWSSNTQTVNVAGVTANNLVQVAPAPSSNSDYVSGGVLCTAQGSGTLTFTCTATPTNAITVNVVIFG